MTIDFGYRLARPILSQMDPESAHLWTIRALKAWPHGSPAPGGDLSVHALGLTFPNPIGLAAGFDKNAEVPDAMLGLGFGFVEVGTVTPLPQAGNPRPRLFRLPEDRAVVNRMGFNNDGAAAASARLRRRSGRPGIVGVNVGANKDAADRIADYVRGVEDLGALGSYVTVNISSPNTPGLRGLQDRAALERLLDATMAAAGRLARKPPVLLKIAPDLDEAALTDIAAVVRSQGADGIIATNTTVARPNSLRGLNGREAGGLSGAPLFAPSTAILTQLRAIAGPRMLLIGVGGVASGHDALAKIKAGASLVQLYSALAYEGPGLIQRIVRELTALVKAEGYASLSDMLRARDGQ